MKPEGEPQGEDVVGGENPQRDERDTMEWPKDEIVRIIKNEKSPVTIAEELRKNAIPGTIAHKRFNDLANYVEHILGLYDIDSQQLAEWEDDLYRGKTIKDLNATEHGLGDMLREKIIHYLKRERLQKPE